MKTQLKSFKISLALLVLLGTQITQAFQQPSKITAVTVYLDGAEINREAKFWKIGNYI